MVARSGMLRIQGFDRIGDPPARSSTGEDFTDLVEGRVLDETVSEGVHKVVVEMVGTQRFADSLHYLVLRPPAALSLFYPAVFYDTRHLARVRLVDYPEDPGPAAACGVGADIE